MFLQVLLSPDEPHPKNVAAFILGGGTGAHLFPLTKTRAVPAVRFPSVFSFVTKNSVNSIIKQLKEYVLVGD